MEWKKGEKTKTREKNHSILSVTKGTNQTVLVYLVGQYLSQGWVGVVNIGRMRVNTTSSSRSNFCEVCFSNYST